MSVTLEPPVSKDAEVPSAEQTLGRMLRLSSMDKFQTSSTTLAPDVKKVLFDILADELKACLPFVVGLARRSRDQWRRLCGHGWTGRVQELHDARDTFLNTIATRIGIVERALRLAEFFTDLSGQTLPEHAEFDRVKNELTAFKAETFDPWQSIEDLKDILAASFPLTRQELDAIGNGHYPPNDWFLVDEPKPF